MVSGCALMVDYVLTITISVAAGGDAIFSFLPPHLAHWKLPLEVVAIGFLVVLNLRGVKESVTLLAPIFLVFLVTHAVLIAGAIFSRVDEVHVVAAQVKDGLSSGVATLGLGGMLALFLRAYSMGAGTYTGIEAVSNGLPIMREPRVETGKRTMVLMAISLALTAGGILLGYLLLHVTPVPGKTMNAVLAERFAGDFHLMRDAVRPVVRLADPALRGPAALRRRAGRLHRRPARHGQHGGRLLGPAPLRPALRPADDAERRAADGRRPRWRPSSTPAATSPPW